MKTITIHQPSYFPWLGTMHKIASADLYIVMDDVQLSDKAYQSRNLFFERNSGSSILTIPIKKRGYLEKTIRELKIADNRWQTKHLKFLKQNYSKAPFFDWVLESIEPIYNRNYQYLIEPLLDSLTISLKLFGINTEVVLQSSLDYHAGPQKQNLVLNLLTAISHDSPVCYLSGTGAKDYQDDQIFADNSIELSYQDFHHPIYEQPLNRNEFVTGLACLDILFNLGGEAARNILLQQTR